MATIPSPSALTPSKQRQNAVDKIKHDTNIKQAKVIVPDTSVFENPETRRVAIKGLGYKENSKGWKRQEAIAEAIILNKCQPMSFLHLQELIFNRDKFPYNDTGDSKDLIAWHICCFAWKNKLSFQQ
jgi:hypothetical protein